MDAGTDVDSAVDTDVDTDAAVPSPSPVGMLPATGFDGLWLVPMSAALLMVGAVLLLVRRNRVER